MKGTIEPAATHYRSSKEIERKRYRVLREVPFQVCKRLATPSSPPAPPNLEPADHLTTFYSIFCTESCQCIWSL